MSLAKTVPLDPLLPNGAPRLLATPRPLPGGMFTAELGGTLLAVTPPLARMLGKDPSALCGTPIQRLLTAADGARLGALIDEIAAGHDRGLHLEVHFATGAGLSLPAWVYLSLLLRPGEQPLLQGLVIDQSFRVQQENEDAALREQMTRVSSLIALGEMASSIAHEVNQPLTAITALAQTCAVLLKSGKELDRDRLLSLVGSVVDEAVRAAQVAKRIRSFVTLHTLTREEITVSLLVSGVLNLATYELRIASVRVSTAIPEDLPPVSVDLIHLQQVMLNLLRNAVDAMATLPAEQRVLTIFAHHSGATVSVSFDDRGAGVPVAEQARLFEPFHTTKPRGTGLGLSTSLRIVQAHGGRLDYETNRDGGARFVLSLPVAVGDAASTPTG